MDRWSGCLKPPPNPPGLAVFPNQSVNKVNNVPCNAGMWWAAVVGRDASEEFNVLHKPDVVEKYIAHTVVGTLA